MTRAETRQEHLNAFSTMIGAAFVLTDPNISIAYTHDWTGEYAGTPICVLSPATTEDVCQVMTYCNNNQIAVIPQGGNTGLVGGSYVEQADTAVLLNLKRMNRIRDLDAIDFSAVVEAGCIVQTVQDAAKDADRLFPAILRRRRLGPDWRSNCDQCRWPQRFAIWHDA